MRGYDAGKKIERRKRHIAADTDGRLLMINLTSDQAGIVGTFRLDERKQSGPLAHMTNSHHPDVRNGSGILAFVTDAHGGIGGISQYNRDALEAICGFDNVREVRVLPRSVALRLGPLPNKLKYDLGGVGNIIKYIL